MSRQVSVELTERVLARVKEDGLDIGEDVGSVNRDEFVGRQRFDADRELFRRSPQVIGWAGEVASIGDYTTKDVMGVPVLVTRAKDGRLRAFINGCMHRGAAVAKDCGNARKFVCPYHAWTYDLDGRLTGVPDRSMFSGIDLDARGLRELPCSERAGLITVGLSEDIALDGHLDEIEHLLSGHRFDARHHAGMRRFDLKMNWKLAVNVNFEGYHFQFLHQNSLHPIATNNSVYDFFGPHVRWAFPFRDFGKFAERLVSEWPDQFHGTVVYLLFPGCVLIESPGSWQMLRIYPGEAPGKCVLYMENGSVKPIVTDADRERHEAVFRALCNVLEGEDFPTAESCQSGLEAGVPNIVFGRNEACLRHLAQRWKEASGGPATTDNKPLEPKRD